MAKSTELLISVRHFLQPPTSPGLKHSYQHPILEHLTKQEETGIWNARHEWMNWVRTRAGSSPLQGSACTVAIEGESHAALSRTTLHNNYAYLYETSRYLSHSECRARLYVYEWVHVWLAQVCCPQHQPRLTFQPRFTLFVASLTAVSGTRTSYPLVVSSLVNNELDRLRMVAVHGLTWSKPEFCLLII